MSADGSRIPVGKAAEKPENPVHLGSISGVFGVKGWVKVFSHTSPRDNILSFAPWFLTRGDVCHQVEVSDGRAQGKGVVVQFDGCEDRDLAHLFIGCDIWVGRDLLPATEADEYYWSDLEGLEVWVGDQSLGYVSYLIETGANDVLVVQGDRERLIPFIQPSVITKVDLGAKRIEIDWDPDF